MNQKWYGYENDWPKGQLLKHCVPPDPIFQTTEGWYFCDETWTKCFGPFPTEKECRASLYDYADFLINGPKNLSHRGVVND